MQSKQSCNVFLKPVGSAPPLKQQKRTLNAELTISELISLLKQELQVDSLLLYVNAAFAPSPSDSLGELAKNFASQNQSQLNLNYSITPAWG